MIINPDTPTENALYFAELYMQNSFGLLDTQKANAAKTQEALTKLREALQTFKTALSDLSSLGSVIKYQGLLSNPDFGSVSLGSNAQPGTYNFFVEQLATTHQLSVDSIPPTPVGQAGPLGIELGDGSRFEVDLTSAGGDASGNLTAAAMARAINESPDNKGRVNASVVTINGQQQLVMSAGQTGTDGAISLDTSAIADSALQNALNGADEMIAAQNAVFYLGGEGGTRIEQSSNTFTGIQGVTVNFTKTMQPGDPALALTISRDDTGTEENARAFVDAYNALKTVLDELASSGNPGGGVPAGPMAGDAGVRALQQQLNSMLRMSEGGVNLLNFGISADRNGVLSLDASKFQEALATGSVGLDLLFGSGENGLTGKLDGYLETWTSSTNGQLKSREDSVKKIQDLLSKRETQLEAQYTRVYERYVDQFTRVQLINMQMKDTLDLLDGMFGNSEKK